MRSSLLRSLFCLALLSGCATGVTYSPVTIAPTAATDQVSHITLDKQIDLRLDTGYQRSLKSGSRWLRVGSVAQGEVYKSHNSIFTVEGMHVHEAWLVVANHQLLGFYLPVERGFVPLQQKIDLAFSPTLK